jgi:hypothetical protein
MPVETITELVSTLSPTEQDAVRAFVRFLRNRQSEHLEPSTSSFLLAADEFMKEHPELLHRLGQ